MPMMAAEEPVIRTQRSVSYGPQRNPGVAAVLSFFWPGVGQIYNGELGKGLAMFLLYPALVVFCVFFAFAASAAAANAGSPESMFVVMAASFGMVLLLVFAYWVVSIFDAYRQAERLNRRR